MTPEQVQAWAREAGLGVVAEVPHNAQMLQAFATLAAEWGAAQHKPFAEFAKESLATMHDEAVERQKDTARLDHIQAHTKGQVTCCPPDEHGAAFHQWLVVFDDEYDSHGPISREYGGDTLRAAIDASRGTK